MLSQENSYYWGSFALLSIFLHMILAVGLNFSKQNTVQDFNIKQYLSNKKVTEIEYVEPDSESLKRLRRIGVKGGAKEFSMPYQKKVKKKSSNKLNLESLGTKEKLNAQIKQTPQLKFDKNSSIKIHKNVRDDQRRMQNATLKKFAPGSGEFEVIKRTDLNLSFEPPDGVSPDELNSMEKKFYGFQKRTYMSYINSFVNQYNNLSRYRPGIQKVLFNQKHYLTARATFDKNGDILRIKIIRWSNDDDVQKLFEDTVKSIHALPNPPTELLNSSEEFSIYFSIKN